MNKKPPFLRIHYNAPFTLTFCLACIAVFIGGALTAGHLLSGVFSVDASSTWTNPLTYPRLLLHVFGHASLEHLTSNLVFILLLGPGLEEKHGHVRLTIVAAITALATGTVMMIFFQ